jgi:hypothetical protein
MPINSNEKERFEVGKEYWTFYMELSENGCKLRYYTGVFKTKLLKLDKTDYKGNPSNEQVFWSTKWDTSALSKKSDTLKHNVPIYMNGYGMASCDFYDSYDDAAKGHDKLLIKFAKGQNTSDRATILKKLIDKNNTPTVSVIESESKSWYKKLTKKEQSYVKWIKEFYEEI